MSKFYPLTHFANESGIPIATLLDHCEEGELQAIKVGVGKSRNHYRVTQEWWDAFIEQQKTKAIKPKGPVIPASKEELELERIGILRHLGNCGVSSRPRSRRRVSP